MFRLLVTLEKIDNGRVAFYYVQGGLEHYLTSHAWPEAWAKGRWIELKVESVRDKHSVYVRDINSLPVSSWLHLGTAQTEFHSGSGSIGLFVSSQQTITFNDMTFSPRGCVKMPSNGNLLVPPIPFVCSNTEEAFTSLDIRRNWRVLNEHSKWSQPVGDWRYMLDVYGRDTTITQLNAVDHSQLIWERNRGCLAGRFQFSYLAPNCVEGGIGAVLRMSRQSNGSFLELMIGSLGLTIRQYRSGHLIQTLYRSEKVVLIVNAWTKVLIDLNLDNISVVQVVENGDLEDNNDDDDHQNFESPELSSRNASVIVKVNYRASSDLEDRVGIVTRKCGGVVFSNIKLVSTNKDKTKKRIS